MYIETSFIHVTGFIYARSLNPLEEVGKVLFGANGNQILFQTALSVSAEGVPEITEI